MDYKALEEMYGGIPENTEMDKLIDYLKICPPEKYTYSIVEFCGRPQVIFMDACTGERVADCVCHYGSYGHEHGLIEALGAPLVNEEEVGARQVLTEHLVNGLADIGVQVHGIDEIDIGSRYYGKNL